MTPRFLIAGVIVSGAEITSPAQKKILARAGRASVALADLTAAAQAAKAWDESDASDIEARKLEEILAFRRTKEFRERARDVIRPDIQKIFAQVHDYKQFVTQIIQNINVVLETRYGQRLGETTIEELLDHATHEERAIYWSARLMESKLEAANFMLHPELIDRGSHAPFRFHGQYTKYFRIYQRAFEAKQLKVSVTGSTYGYVDGNGDAIGVIPHTFLDNALKYSPVGAPVAITLTESSTEIEFSVSNFGPRLAPGEAQRIFEQFYRGKYAREVEPEGMGFGLGLAQLVAERTGIDLIVAQATDPTWKDMVWTTFTARIPKGAR